MNRTISKNTPIIMVLIINFSVTNNQKVKNLSKYKKIA